MGLAVAITVKSCSECPFFEQNALVGLALLMPSLKEKLGPFPGTCDCPTEGGVLHFPIGSLPTTKITEERRRKDLRLRIRDANTLPAECPLRTRDVVVTLGS